jgi:predicted Fe-Mo cluster-binding NifX family protein
MKVAISSSGNGLNSPIDPRFGRCSVFIIVDTNTMKFQAVPNASIGAAHGAGIGAAQSVAQHNVTAVITGHVGPNAHTALSHAGIKIYTGAVGTVANAVDAFKSGKLTEAISPTVGGHFGLGGRGRGMGQGRRRGYT